jgi:RNA polymerase sigma-70 factor (ECF subfamily)
MIGGLMRGLAKMKKEPVIDWRVIKACQEGDRDAYRVLFEGYQDRTYNIAYHFCGDANLARDLTQQVFLKLFKSIGQFRFDSDFSTWLYRMVANVCIDEDRKRRRFVPWDPQAGIDRLIERRTGEDSVSRKEMASSVRRAVTELKPKLRIVILLKYFEEMSYEEMAAVLGCSSGTVASRLNRGHRMLATKLAHMKEQL